MLWALIKKLNSDVDNHDHIVSLIVNITDISVLNQFYSNLPDITYSMIVDETVKVGMIFRDYKIYDELGKNLIYPPTLPIDKLNQISSKLDELTFNIDEDSLSLEDLKKYRITKSKINLKTYLENNPYEFNGKYYAITEDKQTQLKAVLDTYENVIALNKRISDYNLTDAGIANPKQLIECSLTWNETGKACEDWTYDDLLTLFFNIFYTVKTLVTKQQHMEIDINNCISIDEVKVVNIVF